jgi:hypothetical protein
VVAPKVPDEEARLAVTDLMGEAGFVDATEIGHLTKRIGRLTYYRATSPPE